MKWRHGGDVWIKKARLVWIWFEGGWNQQHQCQLNLKYSRYTKPHTFQTTQCSCCARLCFLLFLVLLTQDSRSRLHLSVPQYPTMATMIRKQHTAMTTGWTTGEYVRTAASSSLEEKRERGTVISWQTFCLFIGPSCSLASSFSHRAAYLSNTPVANKQWLYSVGMQTLSLPVSCCLYFCLALFFTSFRTRDATLFSLRKTWESYSLKDF